MEVELSKTVGELVDYAIATQDGAQARQVKKQAKKLYKKEKLRREFQYGLKGDLTLISFAAAGGHQLLFEILLDYLHVDPKITHSILQTTPLHHAAAYGQEEMVGALVTKYSAPLDVVDACGSTPLYLAIMKGKANTVRRLIDLGASVQADNIYGSPLHVAAFAGDISVVQTLYETSPQIVNRELYGFCTPVVAAMCGTSIQCVEYLAQFSNVERLALASKAIACYSSEEKALECLEILSDRGMDPNLCDEVLLEETPILFAARRGWRKVVQILLPQTVQIAGIVWSVEGVFEHVHSEAFKSLKNKQIETLRIRCIQELRSRNFLASEYILKVLGVDMDHEDFVLLQSLHQILVRCATASYRLECMDEDIHTYGFCLLQGGEVDDALQAAQACLALDRDKKENNDFMIEVMRRYGGRGPSTSSSANH